MKARSVIPMLIAKAGYIVMSAVLFILGLLFIARPDISATAVSYSLGAALMVFGCFKLVGYFSRDLFRLAFQYDLQFGTLFLICGLAIVLKSANAKGLLFVAVGITLIADNLFKIQIAIDSKNFGIKKWWGIIVLTILALAIATVLTFRPFESFKAMAILLGATLITQGTLSLFLAVTTVKIIKHQYPDRIEEKSLETKVEGQ